MGRKGDWMQTYTGRRFWPLDPHLGDIDIEDIAHALSHTCRFNGHCSVFYSVAQHSVIVSQQVPQEHALAGLLHDAAEAYTSDIVSPLKPFIAGYQEVEDRVERVVFRKFGLPPGIPKEVKIADRMVLADEARCFMRGGGQGWNLTLRGYGLDITPKSSEAAKSLFLERFYFLTEGEQGA